MLSPDDARLLERLHGDLPLTERPFADVAAEFGWTEDDVIGRLSALLESGMLTRFGPLFQIERCGGAFVLAALQVPEDDWETVCRTVNAFPEVAHNYRRTHRLNMWFVLATETPEGIRELIPRIEAATGLPVHAFPKEREYFVEMKLPAREQPHG